MALTNNNLVKVNGAVADEKQEMADAGAIVTTVGDPGSDVSFPTEKAVRSAVAAVAGDLSTHTTTHPIPTTRDDRNDPAGAAGAVAGDLSTHITTHPIPTTRDDRNEAALGNPVTDDYILSSKADGTRVWVAPGGGGGIDWNNVITENTTAAEDKGYLMNASINPVTLTLPASPTTGDVVGVALLDKTNTAVVARNGLKIMGEETDLTLDVDDVAFTLIYSGAAQGWKILTYLPLGGSTGSKWEADGATSIKPTDSKTVSMDNMVEGADAKVLTAAERTAIDTLNATPITQDNILINTNGNAMINQRGASVVVQGDYSFDRWRVDNSDVTTLTVSQETTGARFTATTKGAGTAIAISQYIETPVNWRGKTITLSARMRQTGTSSNAVLRIFDGAFTDIDVPNDGEFHTVSVTTTVGAAATSLRARIDISIGADGQYVEFEWIKLEEGSKATPWRIPDPAIANHRCDRYTQAGSTRSINGTLWVPFRNRLRVTPTVTPSAGSAGNITVDGFELTHDAAAAVTFLVAAEL